MPDAQAWMLSNGCTVHLAKGIREEEPVWVPKGHPSFALLKPEL